MAKKPRAMQERIKIGKMVKPHFFLAVEIHVSRLLVPRPIYVAALAALPSTDLGAFIM